MKEENSLIGPVLQGIIGAILSVVLCLCTGCISPAPHNPGIAKPVNAQFVTTVAIQARPHWSPETLALTYGHTYYFEIPKGQIWHDWFVCSGPDGYTSPFLAILKPLKRNPEAPWFSIVGSLEKQPTNRIIISDGKTYVAPATGRLFFYANDISWMYWNNCGEVRINVFEVPSS